MNRYEKAEYDFKAIKETVKNSLIIHKDILLEIVSSLEKRHLKFLTAPNLNDLRDEIIKELNENDYGYTWIYDCGFQVEDNKRMYPIAIECIYGGITCYLKDEYTDEPVFIKSTIFNKITTYFKLLSEVE